MAKLTYIKDDLFTTSCDVIAHSVNCQGKFNAGIARQMAENYPQVKEAYLSKYKFDRWVPGQCQFVMLSHDLEKPPFWFVNMATQDRYGRKGKFTDYKAVEQCLRTVLSFCDDGKFSLAIPKIGSGLGGGDWSVIEDIILNILYSKDVNVNVYIKR